MNAQMNANVNRSKKKYKILVIEDNDERMKKICDIAYDHYDVIQTHHYKDGFELMKHHYADLYALVIDMSDHQEKGYQFLSDIKKCRQFPLIPIICLADQTDIQTEIDCLKLGAMCVMSNLFHKELFLTKLAKAIQIKQLFVQSMSFEYDMMTGLYTQAAFCHYMEQLLKTSQDTYDLIFIDIDHFKYINERYGHDFGDEIIIKLANQIMTFNPQGINCHISADRFVALFKRKKPIDQTIIEKDLKTFSNSLPIQNVVLKCGIYEDVNKQLDSLIAIDYARIANRRTKENYHVNVAFYNEKHHLQSIKEQRLIETMEQALNNEEFEVYYQSKHDVHTNEIVGAEALIRWNHPDFGFLSPAEFIPLFEKIGFINNLDHYVIEKVCQHLSQWRQHGYRLVPISINASRKDFEADDYLAAFIKTMKEYEIPSHFIHIEITESVYLKEEAKMNRIIDAMRKKGLQVELDDFGAGYSSLNILSTMPLDIVKFDMKFVGDFQSSKKKEVLSTCIQLTKRLGFKCVIEGVETKEQLDIVKEMGCDYVQGYYFSQPVCKEQFEQLL